MAIVGFDLHKGFLRYSVLDGNKAAPVLVYKERHTVLQTESIPELMDWFESTFRSILTQYTPTGISYRLSLEPKKDQISYLIYPWAILNLISYQNRIPISFFTCRALSPARLVQPKDTDLYSYCDTVFGNNPPYWDIYQKNSILVAWFNLP